MKNFEEAIGRVIETEIMKTSPMYKLGEFCLKIGLKTLRWEEKGFRILSKILRLGAKFTEDEANLLETGIKFWDDFQK